MLLRDTIYQTIRRAILTCEFQPGQELREQVLAERYRVSRSPIRDSLLRLELENLVTVLPRQGYRVKPVSHADVEDVFALRLLLEPACAAGAARADACALRGLDRFRGLTDPIATESGYIEYNETFHTAVADLCGNARMAAVARDLVEQFNRLVRVAVQMRPLETGRRGTVEHAAIIDALQARDADRASQLSYEHAQASHDEIAIALQFAAEPWDRQRERERAVEPEGISYDCA